MRCKEAFVCQTSSQQRRKPGDDMMSTRDSAEQRLQPRSPNNRSSGASGRRAATSSFGHVANASMTWRMSHRAALSPKTELQLRQHKPKRIDQHLSCFSSTMTLRGRGITSLEGMGSHKEVTTVFLQQNFLTSFKGWEHMPKLVELHAGDNLIENFMGIAPSSTIETLVLSGNPIAQRRHYRLMAVVAFGKNLRTIDHEPVTRSERERALALGKAVGQGIRNGWLLDDSRNPDSDFDFTLEEYLSFQKHGTVQLGQPRAVQPTRECDNEYRHRDPAGERTPTVRRAKVDMMCEDCEEGDVREGGKWCSECGMMMCLQCSAFHLRSKRTRSHRLQPVDTYLKTHANNLRRKLADEQQRNAALLAQLSLQDQITVAKQVNNLLARTLKARAAGGARAPREGSGPDYQAAAPAHNEVAGLREFWNSRVHGDLGGEPVGSAESSEVTHGLRRTSSPLSLQVMAEAQGLAEGWGSGPGDPQSVSAVSLTDLHSASTVSPARSLSSRSSSPATSKGTQPGIQGERPLVLEQLRRTGHRINTSTAWSPHMLSTQTAETSDSETEHAHKREAASVVLTSSIVNGAADGSSFP